MPSFVQLVCFRFASLLAVALLLAGCQVGGIPPLPTRPAASATPSIQATASKELAVAPLTPVPSSPASPEALIPAPTFETAIPPADMLPVVDPLQMSSLEPQALEPLVTAPLIFLGDWSPDGSFLPVYTFTQEQLAGLDLVPEGPLTYPPVTLRFIDTSSGQTCDYPRPAQVGAEALDWLPKGRVAVREADGWWSGLPCAGDFQPVGDPQSLNPYLPEPGLSPDGRFRASRFFDIQEGIVYNETTLTEVESEEAVQTIAWQQEERIGDWAESGPGGRWLDDRYFLIPQTFDQGPLLIEANQRVIPILPEFFGEPFTPCTPEACRIYRAQAVDSPAGLHILLQTSEINSGANSLRLYHGESGEVEKLPLAYPWVQPFSPQGGWLMLDRDGNYHSLWYRLMDPSADPPRLFLEGVREFSWAPQGKLIAVRGPQENQVMLLSFPQGEPLDSWITPDYSYGSLATWSPQGEHLAVLGFLSGVQESGLFLLTMPGDRD